MPDIPLTKDQVTILTNSKGSATLTDEEGHLVGYVSPPLSAEELKKLERRADLDGPWYTTAEVMAHLKSLESP